MRQRKNGSFARFLTASALSAARLLFLKARLARDVAGGARARSRIGSWRRPSASTPACSAASQMPVPAAGSPNSRPADPSMGAGWTTAPDLLP